MPFPVVVGAVAIAVSVLGGSVAMVDGGLKMKQAKAIVSKAEKYHAEALAHFQSVEHRVQSCAAAYGGLQLRVQVDTLGAWVQWLEANERKVRLVERSTVDGVDVQVPNIPELKTRVIESVRLLNGGVGAAAGAYAAYQAALWGVGSFAAASTGTAISGLTGVAATNATLAWLGGGSLAAGGGGMALGSLMLTGIAAAPAALLGGFVVGVQGHKALTKATQIDANVAKALAEMAAKEELLGQVESRMAELESIIRNINDRAIEALARLSRVSFDPEVHLEKFQQTALLMRALGEILSTPIVDSDGSLTSESLTVKERYSR